MTYPVNQFNVRTIILIFLISVVFSDFIRAYVFSNFLHVNDFFIQNINFYAIACLLILVFKEVLRENFNVTLLFFWAMGFLFCLLTFYKASLGFHGISTVLFCYMFPLLIIGINLKKEELTIIFNKCLSLLNTVVCILMVLGIFDYITKGSFQLFLLKYGFFNERYVELVKMESAGGTYRYYSLFGHPLRTAQLFLTFFILNNIFNKYFYTKMNPFIVSVITLIGVTLSNSKTGVLLSLILILFFNSSQSKKGKRIYWFLSLVMLIFLLSSQFFGSTVLKRVSAADLSGGRNDLVHALINGTIEKPGFLGGGTNFSLKVSSTGDSGATSFEYPLIMFSYDLGIGPTLFLYIILLIYPLYKLIMYRNYYLAFMLIILSLDVNSYNGLTNVGDFMLQLSFVIFLTLNTNKYIAEVYSKKHFKIRWKRPLKATI